jgi:hypothetical protein
VRTKFGEVVPLSFGELTQALAGFDLPWWIAGGWAIDLFLGEQTREHDDVEIGVLAGDQEALRATLDGWDLHVVDDGTLYPWAPEDRIELPRHQLWARRTAREPWSLEILFEHHDDESWIFRRDARIRMPLDSLGRSASDGLPIMAPEVQLLFKAKDARARDEHDFAAALPSLDPAAIAWLRSALTRFDDAHPWLSELGSGES